jgi:hypothetical protein
MQIANRCAPDKITNSAENSILQAELTRPGYSRGTDHKENTSPIPLLLEDVITGTDHKENAGRFHCCDA